MNEVSKSPAAAEPIRLSEQSDFSLGVLHVRPSLREVCWNGRKEQLEPRVMQVLVALARAGGAVVSRDELIEQCWEGRIVGEDAINRCVSRIRQLADLSGDKAFKIETIPRVGYRLARANEAAGTAGASATTRATAQTKSRRRPAFVLAMLVAVVAIAAAFAVYQIRLRPKPQRMAQAPRADQASIAVLPFKNLSSDKDAGYLALGVQDEILTRLAKIGSLKVISRTSTAQFASGTANILEIARRLGVANVVEGNVQKVGDTIRINVQLIRASSDEHLWAEDYDRKLVDVLSVESDVAGAIATVLAAKVTPGERREITAKPTINAQAYDFYLRALVFAHKNDDTSLRTAVQLLDQAVAADPKFALAWAWLARVQAYMHLGENLASVRRGVARAALARALRLQPDLAEAHAAKGFYLYYGEMNCPAAERELERVHVIRPSNAEILEALALVQRCLGKWNESRDSFAKLIALDPLVPTHRVRLANVLILQHDFTGALRVLDDALKIWPDDRWILAAETWAYQQMGQLDQAAEAFRTVHPAPEEGDFISTAWSQFWLQRQYDKGAAFIRGMVELEQEPNPDHPTAPLQLMLAEFLRMKGDAGGAKESYTRALEYTLEELKKEPNKTDFLVWLPMIYCGLADFRMAMRSADHAVEVLHSSKNIYDASNAEAIRVRVVARLGNRGQAISELARLLKLPGDLTPAILRLDPDFDALRGDPRFEALLHNGVSSRR